MVKMLRLLNYHDSFYQKLGLKIFSEFIVPAKPNHIDKVSNAAIKGVIDEDLWGKILCPKTLDQF